MKHVEYVCFKCGNKYGKQPMKDGHICSCHESKCDICDEKTVVTNIRDFGYLNTEAKLKGFV